MFSLPNLCKNASYLILHARRKSKVHWAKQRRKNSPKDKAMSHFDDFYGSVFGKQWEPMKEALLRKSKYVAVVNNYGDAEETAETLTNRGAHNLQILFQVQKDFHDQYSPKKEPTPNTEPSQPNTKLEDYISRLQTEEISGVYSQGGAPEKLETADMTLNSGPVEKKVVESLLQTQKTLAESLAEPELDMSRIIDPSMGLTTEALYQYVPATKLKGMDDWVPESLHYSYYSEGKDFPLVIEQETEFKFPEHLKVYTYERDSEWSMFPEPKRCQTGVYNYYPLDGASVLAVLALCLTPGDRVLDLCAAPGGKSLVALQTLLPDVLVCNDSSVSRTNRLRRIFRDYLFDFETSNKWRERVVFSNKDGRVYVDDVGFDKVLVDVPCTTDRHSVNEDENNIFRPDRVKERLKIPEAQAALLMNALRIVKVGGAVVYSTCSLSPIQNDGVVHMALKNAFETYGIIATVKDLSSSMAGFASTMQLGTDAAAPKYGQLVLPSNGANFGPAYFARLVRVK